MTTIKSRNTGAIVEFIERRKMTRATGTLIPRCSLACRRPNPGAS